MSDMTTTQAARTYGTHQNVLNRLILVGRIKARKNGDGRWLISRESLEVWNRQRVRRAGKPSADTESFPLKKKTFAPRP
jgi:excisionase family DNA binding protein